jgi:hypothetical protein
LTKTKGVSQRQIKAVRSYARKGWSANRIQQKLRARHMGMRRTKLLGYVREFKGQPARPQVEKYTRMKYRHRPVSVQFTFPKTIILRGKWKGKNKEIKQTDRGYSLKDFVMREMAKAKHGEGWDARPQVISQ